MSQDINNSTGCSTDRYSMGRSLKGCGYFRSNPFLLFVYRIESADLQRVEGKRSKIVFKTFRERTEGKRTLEEAAIPKKTSLVVHRISLPIFPKPSYDARNQR